MEEIIHDAFNLLIEQNSNLLPEKSKGKYDLIIYKSSSFNSPDRLLYAIQKEDVTRNFIGKNT